MPALGRVGRPPGLQRAGGGGAAEGLGRTRTSTGHVRVSGDPAVTKLLGNVIQRQLART